MNQPRPRIDMRQQMPETAKWVEAKRAEFGKAHVNDCITRAMKGEAGLFYAMEGGHVLGTPFPASHPIAVDQHQAVLLGCTFAGFMAIPGSTHGTH